MNNNPTGPGLLGKLKALLGGVFNLFALGGGTGGIAVRAKGAARQVTIYHDGGNSGFITTDGTTLGFTVNGVVNTVRMQNDTVTGSIKCAVVVAEGALQVGTTGDTAFTRAAAGVFRAFDGTNGCWVQNTGGRAALTADVPNSTNTMTNLSGLTITLKAGRKYSFVTTWFITNSIAAEGFQWDNNGGTATMTSFKASALLYGSAAVVGFDPVAALATAFTMGTIGTATMVMTGSMVVNGAGTWIPRFAQVAHAAGTATVQLGSCVLMEDLP